MYKKILVPLDGSRLSEGVLPYVRLLAPRMGVPIELFRVNDPAQHRPSSFPRDREYLEQVAASLSGITDVRCTVESGSPAGMIVDRAAEAPDTLLAMATHGYSGAQRWFLGSVAEKVLQATANHLLLVRPGEGDPGGEASLKTLLVPLDGSGLAEKVLPTVTELAIRLNLEVVLVRVLVNVDIEPPEAVLPVFGAHIPDRKDLWEQARLEASNYLSGKVDELRAAGLPHVSSVLIEASGEGAAGEIIDLAKNMLDTLVVMSTHGRSGIGRWVMGSVAERVVRHCGGPVLVIRPGSLIVTLRK